MDSISKQVQLNSKEDDKIESFLWDFGYDPAKIWKIGTEVVIPKNTIIHEANTIPV
ncbi:MAG: hypothetical protein IJH77_03060 [Mogibacterium sp.]|nr:hypothetical protein [Mogibacterium sp.]